MVNGREKIMNLCKNNIQSLISYVRIVTIMVIKKIFLKKGL